MKGPCTKICEAALTKMHSTKANDTFARKQASPMNWVTSKRSLRLRFRSTYTNLKRTALIAPSLIVKITPRSLTVKSVGIVGLRRRRMASSTIEPPVLVRTLSSSLIKSCSFTSHLPAFLQPAHIRSNPVLASSSPSGALMSVCAGMPPFSQV